MRLSHSRVETFKKCPYQFKLHYKDELEALPTDDPANALILGHALHTGIEKNVKAAIDEYYSAYPIITDRHVEEVIKLEYWLPKIKDAIPPGGLHEVEIKDGENFIGFIDYLVPVELTGEDYGQYGMAVYDDTKYFDLYDWKYSNNVKNYIESGQLHEYKYYFEKLNPGKKIRNMYFMFVPKSQLRIKYKNKKNKRDETIHEFRKRIIADLDAKELQFVKIDYNTGKVIAFLDIGINVINATEYPKNPTRLCDWCDYKKLCEKGDNVDMALPSTKRRTIESNSLMKIWFYGLPFTGKTYLANKFDTPLMLNTDGNIKQVDAPVIRIKDEVKTEGRITKRKFAWKVFTDAIDDLEKGSKFKTIIVDLLEDVYDACRVYVCQDHDWEHESDDSFKAYDIVRSEFIRTMKRLLNLDYNIILISHEDTSRDITKKTGNKITTIKPNIQDKVALKIAGMVDICCRVINDDGNRIISFKSTEVEFGGGRMDVNVKEIPCTYTDILNVYGYTPASPSVSNDVSDNVEGTTAVPEGCTHVVAPRPTANAPEEQRRKRRRKDVEDESTQESDAEDVQKQSSSEPDQEEELPFAEEKKEAPTGKTASEVEKAVSENHEKVEPPKRKRRKRTEE